MKFLLLPNALALVVTSFLFFRCGQSEQEKLQSALNEVERLKILKDKTAELIVQQEANRLQEVAKNSDLVIMKTRELALKRKNLKYWETWHIKKGEEIIRVFNSKFLNVWERALSNKEKELKRKQNLLNETKIRMQQAEARHKSGSVTLNLLKARYKKDILHIEDEIAKLKKEITQLKNKKPRMPPYEKPERQTARILECEEELRIAEEKYKLLLNPFEKNMKKIEADLRIIKSAYDSISALHTNAVFQLSKFKNK